MATYIITLIAGMAVVVASELFIRWCNRSGHESWIPPEEE